ncbi:MAG: hypothetical protein WCC89_00675 [Candidatus Sulfotelmatobacter sp.]
MYIPNAWAGTLGTDHPNFLPGIQLKGSIHEEQLLPYRLMMLRKKSFSIALETGHDLLTEALTDVHENIVAREVHHATKEETGERGGSNMRLWIAVGDEKSGKNLVGKVAVGECAESTDSVLRKDVGTENLRCGAESDESGANDTVRGTKADDEGRRDYRGKTREVAMVLPKGGDKGRSGRQTRTVSASTPEDSGAYV